MSSGLHMNLTRQGWRVVLFLLLKQVVFWSIVTRRSLVPRPWPRTTGAFRCEAGASN